MCVIVDIRQVVLHCYYYTLRFNAHYHHNCYCYYHYYSTLSYFQNGFLHQ